VGRGRPMPHRSSKRVGDSRGMAHGDTEVLAAATWGPGWGQDPWHLWPRLPQPCVAAWVSVGFPSSPGCPGPQDQLREVTR